MVEYLFPKKGKVKKLVGTKIIDLSSKEKEQVKKITRKENPEITIRKICGLD